MRRDSGAAGSEVHLVEYERLKEEQLSRIGVRDNLVYATLAALGGVAVFGFGGDTTRYPALLLLPPVCLVLGWTYLANDQKVSAIGRYIRRDLAPRLRTQRGTDLLRWEEAHRTDAGRRQRKTFQAAVDIVAFCVSGLAALVVFWVCAPRIPGPLLALSVVETMPLALLAVEIIRCADTGRTS
jgi:hypothetical protein